MLLQAKAQEALLATREAEKGPGQTLPYSLQRERGPASPLPLAF